MRLNRAAAAGGRPVIILASGLRVGQRATPPMYRMDAVAGSARDREPLGKPHRKMGECLPFPRASAALA